MPIELVERHDDVTHDLAKALRECLLAEASLGWVDVPSSVDLVQWWQAFLARSDVVTWVARIDGVVQGTASLILAGQPNATHRAEVAKVLVRPAARGRGLGKALVREVERAAASLGRTTLVLDTVTGSPAEAMYAALGWSRVGEVPNYVQTPQGLASTTYFTKRL